MYAVYIVPLQFGGTIYTKRTQEITGKTKKKTGKISG
jgi:hypothetical protein